jgi:hypothetical protein
MDVQKIVEEVTRDKEALATAIYTPWQEAFEQLERRRSDPALRAYVEKSLGSQGLPPVMREKKSIVLFRHVATPNFEITRFMACADTFSTFQPLILEYTDDQFNDRNQWKYFLGKLRFHKGTNKDGSLMLFENSNIINFNESNTKPLSSIKTKWGQGLIDFHHELFTKRFVSSTPPFYDLSAWLHAYGPSAKDYYQKFLTFFLCDAVLFDNFRLDAAEFQFTKEVILPAFFAIEAECGVKPLLVTLAPTEFEADEFWYSHTFPTKAVVEGKMKGG